MRFIDYLIKSVMSQVVMIDGDALKKKNKKSNHYQPTSNKHQEHNVYIQFYCA